MNVQQAIKRLVSLGLGILLVFLSIAWKGNFDKSGVVNNSVFRHANYYYAIGYNSSEFALLVPLIFGLFGCYKAFKLR